ncbi:MAG: hypothetical protein IJ996_00505 [Clostridia bacterium]|nr:hypothetical protein [Clostridia bacterium]
MGAGEIIAIVIIALVIVGATGYIKAKKSGRKCIGCPDGVACKSQSGDKKCGGCNGNCSCCSQTQPEMQDVQEE